MSNCTKIFLGSPAGKNISLQIFSTSYFISLGKTTSTGGLGDSISDDNLKEYFGKFGNIVSVKQIKHKQTGKHKVGNKTETVLLII